MPSDFDNNPPVAKAPAGFTPDNTAPAVKAPAFTPDNTGPVVKAPAFSPDNTAADAKAHGLGFNNAAASEKLAAFTPDNTAPTAKALAFTPNENAPDSKAPSFTHDDTGAVPRQTGAAAGLPSMPASFTPAFINVTGGGPTLKSLTANAADAAAGKVLQGTLDGQLKSYQVRVGNDAEDLPGIVRPANFDPVNNAVVFVQL